MPADQARAALSCLRVDLPSARLDIRVCEETAAADRVEARTALDACLSALDAPPVTVRAPVPWWESPWLWGPVGVVVGVAVTVAVVEVVR